jgi:CheY-like chemotaxis protein
MHNLTINAVQAMPDGGTLHVSGENLELGGGEVVPLGPGRYVRIAVRDEGCGITREHLAKIFAPYFTTKQTGSGLGLAISYSIMKKHGGAITVESELGKGTQFRLYFPASERRATPRRTSPGVDIRGSGRVLVMDDEEVVRRTLERGLGSLGYDVTCVANSTETCEAYAEASAAGAPFDVVVMDLTVPGDIGGVQTLRRLKEIDPSVKAIVSSGYSQDAVMADHRAHGFVGAVAKPFQLREIGEAVARAIASDSTPGSRQS